MKGPMRHAEFRHTLAAVRTVATIALAGNRAYGAAVLLTNVGVSILPAALAYTSRGVIDSLVRVRDSAAPDGTSTPVLLASVFLVLLILQHAAQTLLVLATETLTERSARSLHLALIRTAARLEGIRHFESAEFHDQRLVLETQALYVPMNALRFANDLFSVGISIAAMTVLLSGLHPLVPALMVAFALPDILTHIRTHQLIYEGVRETAPLERLRNYYRSVLIDGASAKEVRLFDLKDYFLEKYSAMVARILAIIDPIRQGQIRRSLWTRLLASAGTILPFVWTVAEAGRGRITPGELVMFTTAFTVIHQQLLRAAQSIAAHQDVINVARPFASWLEMRSDLSPPEGRTPAARPVRRAPAVTIRDLWFRYPGSSAFTLKGLDLDIERGQSLAIVGRNGCGKSTLVKLLCRLYDPDAGHIQFDGVDLRDLSIDSVRATTAVILQDFMRYQLAAGQNIALQAMAEAAVAEKVRSAARLAAVEDTILSLPGQYAALLGRDCAGVPGVELSGGQWQRIALARGFFRDAGMLIMDEPTASLDVQTEALLYADFRRLTNGRTTVLISHRLSTVRAADRIAVIEDGVIAEYGDHEGLMTKAGLYREMFMMQAERYRPVTGRTA